MAIDRIEFHVLCVGQGSANYIEMYDGATVAATILIDLGTTRASDMNAENIDWLNERLAARDEVAIDVVILTHGDADHHSMVQDLKPGLDGGDNGPNWDGRITMVRYGGRAGEYRKSGKGTTISFLENYSTDVEEFTAKYSDYKNKKWKTLWPPSGTFDGVALYTILANQAMSGTNYKNIGSVVSAFSFKNNWFVTTGDATGVTIAAINTLLDKVTLPTVQMITAPHHGSRNTTYNVTSPKQGISDASQQMVDKFVTLVKPKTLSISANETKHHHPAIDVVESFSRYFSPALLYHDLNAAPNMHFLDAYYLNTITADGVDPDWPPYIGYYVTQTQTNAFSTRYFNSEYNFTELVDVPGPVAKPTTKKRPRPVQIEVFPDQYTYPFAYATPKTPAVPVTNAGRVPVETFTNWTFKLNSAGTLTLTTDPDVTLVAAPNMFRRRLAVPISTMPSRQVVGIGAAQPFSCAAATDVRLPPMFSLSTAAGAPSLEPLSRDPALARLRGLRVIA